jgi:hypothetical protein
MEFSGSCCRKCGGRNICDKIQVPSSSYAHFDPPFIMCWFYFASIILGACGGAQWPLVFTIIFELFDLKYYSILCNFGALASPIGSYLLYVRVIGYLYDKGAMKQLAALGLKRQPGEKLNCSWGGGGGGVL